MKKTLTAILAAMLTAAAAPTASAQNPQKGDYGYLFCHMSGRGEWTAYAISRDGFNYHDLRGGEPVFDQTKLAGIEGGTRDAYICRKHDCSGYLMVTTDMCVGKSKVWDNYGINLLTSDDMLNWKSVTFDFRKGAAIFSDKDSPDPYKDYSKINRVWAPQIFWAPAYVWPDGRKGGYLIYYSMLNRAEEAYDRMYYSYADESFTTLTKPRLLFDWGYATIDADINYLESDGLYHMMIKKEGGTPGLFTATAPKLTGPWSEPVDDDYVDFEGKKKFELAQQGIERLRKQVDTLILIPNQYLLKVVENNTPIKQAFLIADDVLYQGVQGISELITEPGEINIDFADVKTVMKGT